MEGAKMRDPKTWLAWTALLLLITVVAVMLGAGLGVSQATSEVANSGIEVGKTVNMTSVRPGQVPVPLYTVTFTNTSGTDIVLEAVTDTLPAGFQFIDMHPSSDWPAAPDDDDEPEIVWLGPMTVTAHDQLSLVYSVYVPESVASSTTPYENSVEAMEEGGTYVGPASAKLLVGSVELSMDKTASPTRVLNGESLIYSVVFANSGSLTGTVEFITDTLDPSLSFVAMASGSDWGDPSINGNVLTWPGSREMLPYDTLLLRYEVQTSGDPGWSWPDNHVEALTSEGMFGDGVEITVGPEHAYLFVAGLLVDFETARLTIDKDASPTTINTNPGQEVVYSVIVRNEGDTSGTLLTVEDMLPDGFTYLDMEAGSEVQADPDGITGTVTWTGPWDMWPGRELTFIYRVDGPGTEGTYTNYANLTAEGARVPDGPASATITVEPGIMLEENFEGGWQPGWEPFVNAYSLEPEQWYWSDNGVLDSGAVNWNPDGPNRTAEDGLFMYLGPGAEGWTDYRVEAKVMIRTEAHPQGLWVRGQWEPSDTRFQWVTGYYVMIGGKPGKADHYMRLLQLQTLEDCWGPPCPSSPEYEPGKEINLYNMNNPHELITEKKAGEMTRWQWHTVVVEVRGNNIQGWVDGVQHLNYTDEKEPFLTGTIGFKTFSGDEEGTVGFDEILVTPLD